MLVTFRGPDASCQKDAHGMQKRPSGRTVALDASPQHRLPHLHGGSSSPPCSSLPDATRPPCSSASPGTWRGDAGILAAWASLQRAPILGTTKTEARVLGTSAPRTEGSAPYFILLALYGEQDFWSRLGFVLKMNVERRRKQGSAKMGACEPSHQANCCETYKYCTSFSVKPALLKVRREYPGALHAVGDRWCLREIRF